MSADDTTKRYAWWCYVVGHRWWCGSVLAIPWDGIAAVRWCKLCGQTQAHYGCKDGRNWWEIVSDAR